MNIYQEMGEVLLRTTVNDDYWNKKMFPRMMMTVNKWNKKYDVKFYKNIILLLLILLLLLLQSSTIMSYNILLVYVYSSNVINYGHYFSFKNLDGHQEYSFY